MGREHLEGLLIGFGTGVFCAFGIIWVEAVVRYMWRRRS